MAVHTIRVAPRDSVDPAGDDVLNTIHRLDLGPFSEVRVVKVYRLEGVDEEGAELFASRIIDVDQDYTLNEVMNLEAARVIEVGYKPGVMNPEAASLMKVGSDLGLKLVAADSSIEYHFFGPVTAQHAEAVLKRMLLNETVQRVIATSPETLVVPGGRGKVRLVPIRSLSKAELVELSLKRQLHLNGGEMEVAQQFFVEIGREPTDAELELIAQWWSEHCYHKTFKALVQTPNGLKAPLIERLKNTAARFYRGVISAFEDNSGVLMFYDGWALNAKVETHNSPSAIEPYGGAATGTGGVLRDIVGTGEGAKVIAATDIFCLGPPPLPLALVLPGCLHPEYLLRRVVAGVGDYGNRMGVPTVNGSFFFHEDFSAKPSVIVGAYGIMPADKAKKGKPEVGDLVFALGGRTGRDGIHGATFSSGEMTGETATVNGSAVQIGNAIEEHRLFKAMLRLRDQGFIRAQTDCGAGGFSSAIGEMGSKTGVEVWLERAPLKYLGLEPWEILLSESQERMVIAIRPEDVVKAVILCKEYNVEATVVGKFTDTKRFVVTYYGESVVDLSYAFLDEGLPQRTMRANWVPPKFAEPSVAQCEERSLRSAVFEVMGHLNVASREPVVRRYDHGVQGTNVLPPYLGARQDGPSDAAVLRPLPDKPYGVVISHGLAPLATKIDPFWGSVGAGVEALANLAAVGGRVKQGEVGLIDNFIWPFPDEESMGALDLAVDAACTLMATFEVPFISGKDSLSGTFRNGKFVLKIPPVFCVSAFGRIPDVEDTVSADFKSAGGSEILLVGRPDFEGMGGSVFYDLLKFLGERVPRPDLENLPRIFEKMYEWIGRRKLLAAHDVSDGGIAAAVIEMCFGGDVGAEIDVDAIGDGNERWWRALFNQTPGCFVVEVLTGEAHRLMEELPGLVRVIGRTLSEQRAIAFRTDRQQRTYIPLDDLRLVWKRPLEEVFGHATF